MKYQWIHITHGLLAESKDIDLLIERMKNSDYPMVNEGRLREGLQLSDEYEYFNGVFKVQRIINP